MNILIIYLRRLSCDIGLYAFVNTFVKLTSMNALLKI